MKKGKILIIMILAALGFQANAQRGVFVHESYNSVRKYIHPLRLSHNQVVDWTKLNRHVSTVARNIERDRHLSPRMKGKKIRRLYDKKDRRLREILSRRQYNKFRNMRSFDSDRRGRYDYDRRGDNRRYRDRDNRDRDYDGYYDRPNRRSNQGCPATGNGSYYDGDPYYGTW